MATKLGILEVQRTKRGDGSTELSLDFGSTTAENGKYDEVVLQIVPQEIDTLASLATRCREVLKPGGKLTIRCAEATDSKASTQVLMQLMVAGLLGPVKSTTSAEWQATTPTFQVGSKVPIKMKTTSVPPKAAWTLDPSINTDDLIDEDELLTEEDLTVRPVIDCGPSTSKKACKNCSCGRAEAEAAGIKPKLTKAMIENPQSNCGSCGLGDAFRCAGCPYRGLPSFKPGEKIQLPSDFLLADA